MQDTQSSASSEASAVAAIAVSTVIFAMDVDNNRVCLRIPLVRRIQEPFAGLWALPGGWIHVNESLSEAAARTLAETTALRPSYLEQLYSLGQPDRKRNDNARVLSVFYSALVRQHEAAEVAEDDNVRWFNTTQLPLLAFDHTDIITYALWRLRNKVEYAHVAFYFLGDTFTMGQLREVYEVILDKRLDPANFRRRVESSGAIESTAERVTGGRHRPPRLYRTTFVPDQYAIGPTT